MRMMFARVDDFTFRPRWLAGVANTLFVGTYYSEERHPISSLLHRLYEGPCRFVLRHPKATIAASLLLVMSTAPVYLSLGSEFMPPLREGTILYMPSAVEPGMSVAEAQKALQIQDKILRTFPEVAREFGKAGRANTSTDPAPFTMMETTITLKSESEWRHVPRWYSDWAPQWLQSMMRPFWRDRITQEDLENEMNAALQLPGISNAWTMPIKGRLDMLSTGIRTPVGIKVSGIRAHVILGLPGETREMMMETARHLAVLAVEGVKIHALYVVEGTPLAELYNRGGYRCLEQEAYVDLVLDFLERLPPSLVVQRLTGDPMPDELVAVLSG